MPTYLVRSTEQKIIGVVKARNIPDLFWLVDEFDDPGLYEYRVLKSDGGIFVYYRDVVEEECGLEGDGQDHLFTTSLVNDQEVDVSESLLLGIAEEKGWKSLSRWKQGAMNEIREYEIALFTQPIKAGDIDPPGEADYQGYQRVSAIFRDGVARDKVVFQEAEEDYPFPITHIAIMSGSIVLGAKTAEEAGVHTIGPNS